MTLYALANPTESLSRGIENLVIYKEDFSCSSGASFMGSHQVIVLTAAIWKGLCGATTSLVSFTVFPLFLTLELFFKKIPEMVWAYGTQSPEIFSQKADDAFKYLLAIIPALLFAFYSAEGMPGFFLKRHENTHEVAPFGVERLFGKEVKNAIQYPKTISAVQKIVREAKRKGRQVSIVGAGMSQGTQTVPKTGNQSVVCMKHLKQIRIHKNKKLVTVGAGATWEQLQLRLDKVNKSVIVKQASDIFSIGGSIGINCHGWAHEYGSISKTVHSMKVIDANGNLRTLKRPREGVPLAELTDDEKLFKCMFGTLGYFGIVVEATLDIVDNEELIDTTIEVNRDQFFAAYQRRIKNREVPLFGGRLVLDTLEGDPMRTIFMQGYRKPYKKRLARRKIDQEPEVGTRIQRIGLKLISHLPYFSAKRLISYFWTQEKAAMKKGGVVTRNEALHPPINAFKLLHQSNLHAQWLQEYFVTKERLPNFLRFLGAELKANQVRLINATIRPTPKDEISILPYAEQDRYAVVICFAQKKTKVEIERTKKWIENVTDYLAAEKGVYYQAYMPFATRKHFERCYGKKRIEEMQRLKQYFDPQNRFGNAHTAKYYDPRRAS